MKAKKIYIGLWTIGVILIFLAYIFRIMHWQGLQPVMFVGLILLVPSLIWLIRNQSKE